MMPVWQRFVVIAMCTLGTQITRVLPFLVFSSDKPTPRYIQYLGKALPAAVFGMLVVYCLKGIDVMSGTHGVPELIAIGVTVALHLWRRNMMLSIAGGTVCYMAIIQLVIK